MLRDDIIDKLRSKAVQQPVSAMLLVKWNSLSQIEQENIILKLLNNPCEGGKILRSMLLDAIESQVNAKADTLLSGATVNRAELEALFSGA